jgi:hypothetical protein
VVGFLLGSAWVCLAALPLTLLTCVGARRRGAGVAAALVAGAFFPVTWAVWYARDERPDRSRHRLS